MILQSPGEERRDSLTDRFNLGLIIVPRVFLYNEPGGPSDSRGIGPQTDEVFSGWAVELLEKDRKNWVRIRTHYGYEGWMRAAAIRPLTAEALLTRQDGIQHPRVADSWMDFHAEPSVRGEILTCLPRGSIVERLSEPERDGWIRLRSADGTEGWCQPDSLRERLDDDLFLLEGRGSRAWFRRRGLEKLRRMNEEKIREAVVRSAMSRLGTPYRWGGKSPEGIDCSGLAFMSWMENGILIWRDAAILPDYPMQPIDRQQLKKGDLIFFPGHVAIYTGGGRYIHATAYRKTPRVTVNSLNPEDPDYRPDLAGSITAFGSSFV